MTTFVLVHGAWQTAATWDFVQQRLLAAGHTVAIPRLTGLEGDLEQLTPAVDLDTHIADVARILARNDLHDVVLVGHSYAGMIITGVAERAEGRIKRLVYADAFVPEDGQSALDLLPESVAIMFRKQSE